MLGKNRQVEPSSISQSHGNEREQGSDFYVIAISQKTQRPQRVDLINYTLCGLYINQLPTGQEVNPNVCGFHSSKLVGYCIEWFNNKHSK